MTATVIQSGNLATKHLGSAESFGLVVPTYLTGTYSAIWSLLHRRQAYTGPCLRVRNKTNNAVGDLAFSGYRVRTTSVVTITAAGTSGYSIGQTMTLATFAGAADVAVVRWYDQSGNSHNLYGYAPTATQHPTLMTAGAFETAGGMPCISFNGTTHRMDTTVATSESDAAAWIQAQPFSVLAVGVTAPSGLGVFWDRKAQGAAAHAGAFYANAQGDAASPRAIFAPTQLDDSYTGASDISRRRCYAARYNGASSKIYVDSVETGSGNAGSNTAEDFRLGVAYYGTVFNAKYHEVLVLPEATSDMTALSRRVMAAHGMM